MLESLVLFTALVLIALIAGKTNSWARLAYALVYFAGIPWLRTAVWFVSLIGLALIFLQLI